MNSIDEVLINTLNSELKQIVISNPRDKKHYTKIKIRPISHKGGLAYHVEKFTNTQVFHDNLDKEECITAINGFTGEFKQLQIYTKTFNYSILISKKGKMSIGKNKVKQQKELKELKELKDLKELKEQKELKKAKQLKVLKQIKEQNESKIEDRLSHNKKKNYILEEGIPVPILIDLGVMTKEGKVVNSKYDKFRQIVRFLEFIQDIVPKLDTDREVKVIDVGCGKSTLTFAVYYYLHVLQGIDVSIIGIDLKEEVIDRCNKLAKQYGYNKLEFQKEDIGSFELTKGATVDMVISLHACDTATDVALAKSISWGAKVILAAPCCQKEVNRQIENQSLESLLKYGLLKERFSSLATDSIRGGYLEAMGYKVQMLDFVDLEHTPKNLLIRGIKEGQPDSDKIAKVQEFEKFLNVETTIGSWIRRQS